MVWKDVPQFNLTIVLCEEFQVGQIKQVASRKAPSLLLSTPLSENEAQANGFETENSSTPTIMSGFWGQKVGIDGESVNG